LKLIKIEINPIDLVLFRNERPFTAGETHIAKLGPISPMTFEGAIKAKLLSAYCEKEGVPIESFQRKRGQSEEEFKDHLNKLVEKHDDLKAILKVIGHPLYGTSPEIRVIGCFFSRSGTEYFPLPNDIVKVKGGNKNITKVVPREAFPLIKWDHRDLNLCLSDDSMSVETATGFISSDKLKKYLCGETIEADDTVQSDSIFCIERRTGIKLKGKSKTVEEGLLYTAEFMRLHKGWSFTVWCQLSDEAIQKLRDYIGKEFLIRLGGEGRGAYCKTDYRDLSFNMDNLISEVNSDGKLKIYFASPAYCKECIPPTDLIERLLGDGNLKLKLKAALPGKPLLIGGYDVARNVEKLLRRWVNSGAVFFYEIESESGRVKDDLSLPITYPEITSSRGLDTAQLDLRCIFIGRW